MQKMSNNDEKEVSRRNGDTVTNVTEIRLFPLLSLCCLFSVMVHREHNLQFMSRPCHERIVLRSSFSDTRFDSL